MEDNRIEAHTVLAANTSKCISTYGERKTFHKMQIWRNLHNNGALQKAS